MMVAKSRLCLNNVASESNKTRPIWLYTSVINRTAYCGGWYLCGLHTCSERSAVTILLIKTTVYCMIILHNYEIYLDNIYASRDRQDGRFCATN